MTENHVAEKVYSLLDQGKKDGTIMRRTGVSEKSLAAYKAHHTRQEKLGTPRARPRPWEVVQRIVYEAKNAGVPNDRIYADPSLRGEKAQRVAGFIASWTKAD